MNGPRRIRITLITFYYQPDIDSLGFIYEIKKRYRTNAVSALASANLSCDHSARASASKIARKASFDGMKCLAEDVETSSDTRNAQKPQPKTNRILNGDRPEAVSTSLCCGRFAYDIFGRWKMGKRCICALETTLRKLDV